MQIAIPLLILLGATASAEAACAPGLAGPTMNWALAVCEARHGTDDVLNPDVQQCHNALTTRDRVPPAPRESCRLNAAYKTEICRSRIAHGFDMSLAACVRSAETIPSEVSNGIGG